jgi:branched-chain amino acid transport system ATP-binding protein
MALLETHGLTARYGDFKALFGIDFSIQAGETVAIIGANGAGKSTFLRAICGLLAASPDSIVFDGAPIGGAKPADIVRRGVAMAPEGRKLFPSLSVEENLAVGAWSQKKQGQWSLRSVYELFPVLKERRLSPATALSGGQQQMVTIGRALMSNPRLLMCDEISLGLAPIVIRDIYAALPRIKQSGASLVIVEQDIAQAMAVADRVYCFQEGRVTLSGPPSALSRDAIHEAYFGH